MYRQLVWLGLTSAAAAAALADTYAQHALTFETESSKKFKCDLPPSVAPGDDGFPPARDLFSGSEALERQVARHGAIVRVPSISYDDMDEVDVDERWEVFLDLHRVLEQQFPKVHERMTKELVNRLGLVYTIKGKDESLKPLMLAAHQDVVPVADPSTWAHPPFSGYFDGTFLWGRGASDDKNSLTALMSALEALLSRDDWTPKRTIILAFGFDEETSGRRGAGTIAPFLEDRYGKDSMAMVLDEGGMGLQAVDDTVYALPAVSEKGHVDVWFELRVLGGHSSIPFPHTGIGIVAEIVRALESHPYEPKLIEGSPVHDHFVCQARYSPHADRRLTRLVRQGDLKALVKELVRQGPATHYRLQTSQAVDLVEGGAKINAMPEVVRLGVNYRVAPQNSINEVKRNVLKYIRPVVKRYRLDVDAFDGQTIGLGPDEVEVEFGSDGDGDGDGFYYDVNYNGSLAIWSTQETQPAHTSPTSGKVWDLFSGTIQHTFGSKHRRVVPVGELMTGNTDTRHYLDLTRNVYRFVPTRQGESINIHTVDERIDMRSHMEACRFYYDLVRNFDRSDAGKTSWGYNEL